MKVDVKLLGGRVPIAKECGQPLEAGKEPPVQS